MRTWESFLWSLLVFIPLLVWLVKRRVAPQTFRPFFLLLIIAGATEILNHLSILLFQTNAVVVNVYSLAECLLLFHLFWGWQSHPGLRRLIQWAAGVGILLWVAENIVLGYITAFHPIFRVSYAFVVVLLSLNEINFCITHSRLPLLRTDRFVLCLGFLVFFLYQILIEGVLYISKAISSPWSDRIIAFHVYINVFTNLVYAAAVWLIPHRSSLTFPSDASHPPAAEPVKR